MSNYSYKDKFEISQAQAIQAIAARAEISPHMNPILLKPLGNYVSNVVIQGKPFKKMSAQVYYKKFALTRGIKIAMDSFSYLKSKYDLIILEGAGSPAEINLQKYDIANMKIAQMTHSPVILVSDIEKGGTFASLVGTMSLLPKSDQKLVRGFVINKFRGNKRLLEPGFKRLHQITSKSVLGVMPLVDLELPNEDSLDNKIHLFRKQNQKKLDAQIEKLAKITKQNLDIKSIQRIIQ
jgi:adenosylcobyric acid synthase